MVAGMAHYQFETLHPFADGNGRVGRFLIVLELLASGVLSEPTLTVSPWFEARRGESYDRLLGVSTTGDWDGFLRFFAHGLAQAATATRAGLLALVKIQEELHEVVRLSPLRADSAHALVDHAIAHPSFTVRSVEAALGLTYPRANNVVGQSVDLGVLKAVEPQAYRRRFYAPKVLLMLAKHGMLG
jgi:Fic family protein